MIFPKDKKKTVLVLVFSALICLTAALGQQATVKEEKQVLKTYPFSDPDPTPLIGPLYPYFKFHGYSQTGKDHTWRMVTLENSYVKVLVAPEIGGKVWGALEKSTGREFVYWNKVVKFREIALRGPWTSGGLEFNFGIVGHTPTTATPVDYLFRQNGDDSVSCIVGAMDLPSRTFWRVNIRLPQDAAYLETECFWFNPTPLHDSLYNWLTSAQDVGEDLKYYYPGTHYIGHGGDAHPWPLAADGRDVSYYRNNNFGGSKSYHILGEYNEYFGGYYEKSGFGYGHWALCDDKPGLKLWIWSLGRDGEIWKDLLTDRDNKQYTEPQTGLLYNQAESESGLTPFKHVNFPPHGVSRWKELWFPVKDIGGLVAASPYAVLNVTKLDDEIKVGVCPLQSLDDELIVKVGGEDVYVKHLTLKPMETFITELSPGTKEGEILVELGKEKMRWASGDRERNTLSRPLVAPKDFDWGSAEGLFVAGEELARQRSYADALAKFLACLEKEPGHVRALTRVAELYSRRGEDEKAREYALHALAIDAYDAGANFIYGVVSRKLGKFADAKDGFGWAARSMEYRSAANAQLAQLNFQEKKTARAEEYARRSLDYNAFNLAARQLVAVISRLNGEKEAAEKALDEIEKIDPLSHFVRFERFLAHPTGQNRESFTSMIRNELPHQTYLELALAYHNLGLETEAARVLELSPPYPMVDYWLAYFLREKDVGKSEIYLQKALDASPDFVFPFRLETISVLRWAMAKSPHWKSAYYLGLILWNIGRMEEAQEIFGELAGKPDWAPFYLTRAKLIAAKKKSEKILADIQRAIALDKENWRAWRSLTAFYEKSGQFNLALQSSKDIYRRHPEKAALAMDFARSLFYTGRYKECLDVLGRTTVLPYEGAWEGRDLFKQAHLFLAEQALRQKKFKEAVRLAEKAKLWPEHLGSGKPFDPDERLENFLLAQAYEKMGDQKKAKMFYAAVAADTEKFRTSWNSAHYLSTLSLRRLGKEDQARSLLDDWRKSRAREEAVPAWAGAKFDKDEQKAKAILDRQRSRPDAASWDLGTGDRYFPLVLKIAEKLF